MGGSSLGDASRLNRPGTVTSPVTSPCANTFRRVTTAQHTTSLTQAIQRVQKA